MDGLAESLLHLQHKNASHVLNVYPDREIYGLYVELSYHHPTYANIKINVLCPHFSLNGDWKIRKCWVVWQGNL